MRDFATTHTKIGFTVLVGLALVEWLIQIRRSNENCAIVVQKGGEEWEPERMDKLILIQAAWFACMLAEVWLLPVNVFILNITVGGTLFLAGQILRFWAIRVMDWKWTLRIVTHRAIRPEKSGPYRFTEQPNLWATRLEAVGLPMLHGALITAFIFYAIMTAFQRAHAVAAERAQLGLRRSLRPSDSP